MNTGNERQSDAGKQWTNERKQKLMKQIQSRRNSWCFFFGVFDWNKTVSITRRRISSLFLSLAVHVSYAVHVCTTTDTETRSIFIYQWFLHDIQSVTQFICSPYLIAKLLNVIQNARYFIYERREPNVEHILPESKSNAHAHTQSGARWKSHFTFIILMTFVFLYAEAQCCWWRCCCCFICPLLCFQDLFCRVFFSHSNFNAIYYDFAVIPHRRILTQWNDVENKMSKLVCAHSTNTGSVEKVLINFN